MSNFNSRPSARGDGRAGRAAGAPRYFNSRPSARGDFRLRCAIGVHHSISIHAPPRGATRKRGSTPQASRNFNSRPSARGDAVVVGLCAGRHISIHAPPRGATASAAHPHIHIRFQFTPLREGRPAVLRERHYSRAYFNSRPSARGDTRRRRACGWNCEFQFTPLREGRQSCLLIVLWLHIFQFTPLREGRRDDGKIDNLMNRISIHAPPRGATRRSRAVAGSYHFNSRPSARGDASINTPDDITKLFQFTPLREGRRQKICNFCKSFVQPLQISMA